MRLWVTRSEPGASELVQFLRKSDVAVEPVKYPVVGIEPLFSVEGGLAERGLAKQDSIRDSKKDSAEPDPQLVVVTSRHAATRYAEVLTPATCPHIAVGGATQRALSEAGIVSEVPEIAGSEGILGMTAVANLTAGNVVWLIKGQEGRSLLQDELSGRNVRVSVFELYRRCEVDLAPFEMGSVDGIEVSSEFALNNIATAKGAQAKGKTVFVPSPRIADAARAQGFLDVVDLGSAAPAALVGHLGRVGNG